MKWARYAYFFGIASIGVSSARLVSFLTLSDAFFIGSTILWLLCGIAAAKRRSLLFNPFIAGLCLIYIGSVLSLLHTHDVLESSVNLVKFTFTIFLVFVLGPALITKGFEYRNLVIAFCLSVLINAVGVVVQQSFGDNLFGITPEWGRFTGFSEDPNELGMHAALGLVMSWVLIGVSANTRWKALAALTSVAACFCMAASASMTALASIGIVLCLATVVLITKVRKTLLRTLGVGSLLVIVGVGMLLAVGVGDENSLMDRVQRQLNSDIHETTLGSRLETYDLALSTISSNPVVGVGSSEADALMANGHDVHNIFLRGYTEGGLFEFLGLLLIYSTAAMMLWRQRATWRKRRSISLPLVCLFVCLLVLASFAPISFRRIAWLPFAFIFIPRVNNLRFDFAPEKTRVKGAIAHAKA